MEILPNVHFSFSGKGKYLALTFDDGPHPDFTPQILNILHKHNVKATFFVSGSKIELYNQLIADELAMGHQVANHSYNHRNFLLRSQNSMQEDIEQTDKLLRKYGVKGAIPFRPPYGRFDLGIIRLLKKMKKQMILWNISTKDYKATSAQQILQKLDRKVRPGAIIVMHDAGKFITSKIDRTYTIETLNEFLPKLKEQGYKFLTINEMLNL